MLRTLFTMTLWTTLAAMLLLTLFAPAPAADLPDPDGKPADMSKPVQVFILMGQSNMLGFGKINGGDGSLEHATGEKGLYPYLINDSGEWTTRQDVRNVFVMAGRRGMQTVNNEWLTITNKNIGPEVGSAINLAK